ncbi:neural-cadherin-like isoform X2 [Podarcis raffonei]|uniref:neural-cadherin-like isoform X2 n=1 Tax=Podarcis raffonei TaxID=65483 RepID=UPI0023297789|nr:neural-cadherin-like isoform X2 [Podarcis raffonei]
MRDSPAGARRWLLFLWLAAGSGGSPCRWPASPRALCFYGQVPENSPPGTRVQGLRVPLRRLLLRAPSPTPGAAWALEGDGASHFALQLLPPGAPRRRPALLLLLRTAERLDREARPRYSLWLTGPSRAALLLRLRVLDRNDHRPRFPPGPTPPLEVDELAPLGSEVARLRALDADEGANARLTYRSWPGASEPGRHLFVVPRSGQVLTVGSLLGLRRLSLWVSAQDHGLPRPLRSPARRLELAVRKRTTTAAVQGAAPLRRKARALAASSSPSYKVRVPVGAPAGELIFTVPDTRYQEAGGSWFEMVSPAAAGAFPVELDRGSGRLSLVRQLERGGRTEVVVKVHRIDGQDHDWYLCRVVIIAVEEELISWEMYPYPYLARVDPDARAGTSVYQLVAHYSGNENSSVGISYALIAGGEERFDIDMDTGVILTTGLPLTLNQEYVVTVLAIDEYGSKSPYAYISILAGSRPPQFTNMSYSVFVPENTPASEKVAVIEAVSFQSQPLSYALLMNPSGLFSMDPETGMLSLTHTVDYESEHHLYHFLVKAMEAESLLSSVTEVIVHITDENDCSPEFQQSIYSRESILESIPIGTSLLQVLAADCDSGSNAEILYFIQSADFSITPEGVVNSNQRLDYERANHMYEFVVIAVDKGHPPRTGTASVRIRLTNVNDETPVFSQSVYRTFLSEDAGPGTLVATIHAKDPDGDGVLYLITGGNEEGNFELDSHKGILRLRRNPLPKLKSPQYVLNISAIDDNSSGGPRSLSSFAEVVVEINDINNNKPVFRECAYYSDSTWVLENQPPGTYVLQVEAYDADFGVNGEVKYGLMHRDGASPGFSIDPDSGVIVSTRRFDREKQKEYTLSVTATDQAQEPLIGVCQITIFIADMNDNDPKFENSRYQYFLREDTPVGTSFLHAAAHDDDQGVNAAITYSMLPQEPEYFQVSPSTGWVYVNLVISQIFQITRYIVATDGGNRSSTVELTVTVTNTLNQSPQWEKSAYSVTIPESTIRDTKIVTIKATSPLGDPRVTYTLEEGQVPETNMPVRFYLKPNRADGSASLLVAEPLDFETTKFFALSIKAQNVATIPLASFTTVCVNVTDVNDNVPFFTSSTYEVSVPEGAVVGTSVVQVLATDSDSGLHGEIHYSILKDASEDYQYFNIDSKLGVISTQASFDREKRGSYLIEVHSQDSSESARPGLYGQPNTDTAYVRILISDINDNAPAFLHSVYEINIDEDEDVGYAFLTATADDKDEGSNAKLRYQITSGNERGDFYVEPEMGTLLIAQCLDYEQEQHYELQLVASDGKWENHTLVIINVVNKNDEAPVFSQDEYHSSVLEELTDLPVTVLRVSATDPDQEADQSALRYSLHGQGAQAEFTISEYTGEITANEKLDREKRSVWRFLVLATDEDGEGLTGFADVIIDMTDVNDNPPLFLCASDGCFMGQIPEDAPADSTVMEMSAVDLDDPRAGKNAVLTYSIIQNVQNEINLNLFSVNPATGTIYTVLGSLDREKEDRYLVVVEAKDGGGLTGTGTATILVTDVNDHTPTFTQKIYTAFVSEGASLSAEVAVVSATDGDEGENAVVAFSIVGGDEDHKFFIETDKADKRGIIRLRKRIDFEKPHERVFNLTVKAEDLDFSSIAHCVIYVEDSNDHAPLFYPQFYEVAGLAEDVPLGTKVVQVIAVDLDSGLNGRFSYRLLNKSDPNGKFSVATDGWVLVAGLLDYETVAQYQLVVIATDMGQPPLSGSATVLVALQDVNDNGPEFEAQYNPVVWENTPSPQIVQMNDTSTLLYAKDRDSPANGAPFSFHLLSDFGSVTYFNLQDFSNGSAMLTALHTFDREVHKVFELRILIADSGIPPMSSTNTLTVNIGDRNDHPHAAGFMECLIYSYNGILPTTVLGQIHAPDNDDWDHKTYHFEGKPPRYFILNDNSGLLSIKEGTPSGTYDIRVKVTDGIWPDVVSTVRVVVKEIKEEAAHNAGSIRIRDITAEDFIYQSSESESKYNQMKKLFSEIIPAQLENVHIFSVLNSPGKTQGVDVWFAIHGSPYYKAEKLNGNVAVSKARLETILNISITQVGIDECAIENCSHSAGCTSKNEFSALPTITSSGNVLLASITVLSSAQCTCEARERKHHSCSSYRINPCFNGGTCTDTDLGYSCKCPMAFHGPECQQTQHTFRGHGYAWFPTLKPCFQSRISLDFITEAANGLLLYNGPMTRLKPGEAEDFIALELSEGVPLLTLSHGSGALLLQLSEKVNVADRRWHNINIINDGKAIQLILDHCVNVSVMNSVGALQGVSRADKSACKVSSETPGSERFLNVHQPLQLGGVKKAQPYHTSQKHFRGFVGCIRNVVLDSQVYNLEHPAESLNSAPGCSLTDGLCQKAGVSSCGTHGKCIGDWGSFNCDCFTGYTGARCDKALPEWTFGKDSWIHYELKTLFNAYHTRVQLAVRTRMSFCTLLSMASSDGSGYIRVEVIGGHFGVSFNLGDKDHTLQLSTVHIDNGQWVELALQRYHNEFYLRVNDGGGDHETSAILGSSGQFEMNLASIVLGNRLANGSESDFQGCMRDVRLNGQPLLVDGKSTEYSFIVEQQGITIGCHSSSCSSQPCYSPFHCVDLWRKYECRCPAGKVEVMDNLTGLKQCTSSPCGHWNCRNGGTCVAQSRDKYVCQCPEGYKGKWCEVGPVKAGRPVGLSSGSILAISMCLLVFLGLLVSYTVWSQWGRSRFRKGGIYHIPEEHESWEDVRENIFNYNEEGGGEHDLSAYNIDALKQPLQSIPHLSSGNTASPLRSHSGPQRNPLVNHACLKESSSLVPDLKYYVSQIQQDADKDLQSLPADTVQVYCRECQHSLSGSLHSLDLSSIEEDLNYNYLQEWGPKFVRLKELCELPTEQL